MKLKLILSLICYSTLQMAIGQSPKLTNTLTEIYRADETKWEGSRREFFEYDGDLLTNYTYQIKYALPNKFVNSRAFEYKYDDNDNLILKLEYSYTSAEAQVQNFYWDEYFYDSNGCLIGLKDSVSSIHGVYTQRFFEYITDENCNIVEELVTTLEPSGQQNIYKKVNVYNDQNLLVLDTSFRIYNDKWIVSEIYDYEYDTAERLIEKRREYYGTSFINIEYEQWEYDENGALILYIRWREKPSNPFQIIYKDSIIVEYDDQNRVINKKEINTRFQDTSPAKYYTYDYYCQDILKQSSEDDLPRIYRTFYEYETGFDDQCAENIEDESIIIQPNPSDGKIILMSDWLGAESALIRVFDTSGKEHFQKSVHELKNTISLDLSFLKRGLYVISIQTGSRVRSEKVSIF
ncbi:T9SS type A sorting domain-containing protein [Saprospiraceae bacterium]|nr:T9SS type A sorting domain-containing protein [Saprospiraceae bacterium]MDF1865565.1 T9SS type A sorting domain-containing protein [Saprospiraceae bacterium]